MTMTKAPAITTWPRSYHEEAAIRSANEALRVRTCPTFAGVIKANRMVAHARSHLVSIGPRESKRTLRLWAFVGKVEKIVAATTAAFEKEMS